MPTRRSPADKAKYFKLINTGHDNATASRLVGIDPKTGSAWLKGAKNASGVSNQERKRLAKLEGPIPDERLSEEALKAKEDFGYFRRRYFGRIASPWQEDAAYKFEKLLWSPQKEYVVLNCPPGAGKSTLLHDIEAWMTVKNRAIRGLLGSSNQRMAISYCLRLRRTLERTRPVQGDPLEVAAGRELDAEATLVEDFGRFQPDVQDLWRNEEFVVAQLGDIAIEEKEPTWSAFGLDTGYLGTRVNLAIWDDVQTKKTLRTMEAIETMRDKWEDEAETRLEPDGMLALVGQRLDAMDLYRYCLDKRVPIIEDDDDDELVEPTAYIEPEGSNDLPRLYTHLKYPAHNTTKCEGVHSPKKAQAWPNGCLLDPIRLPWRELSSKSKEKFEVVYQQEDSDPAHVLVPYVWIKGGEWNGEYLPGCYDNDRGLYEVPKNLNANAISVVTVDPSPTMFWSVQWWVYDPTSELRFLCDNHRQKMDSPDFLDWNHKDGVFTGHLEDIWQISNARGRPFKHLIVEQNGAQRFLLKLDYFQRWATMRGVSVHPHNTTTNKVDDEYGVQTIAPHYRYGRVRLPNTSKRGDFAYVATKHLVDEVTRYPDGGTDDCVMAHWFLEYWIPRLVTPDVSMVRRKVPSWLARSA